MNWLQDGIGRSASVLEWTSLWTLRGFLLIVAAVCLRHSIPLFLQTHGASHRISGGALFVWIALGASLVPVLNQQLELARAVWFVYDVVLGLLGMLATISAARDFPHKRVKNAKGQSGTLSERAIVTQSEMIEHSFYQGLNLLQAIYLHGMACFATVSTDQIRLLALLFVTMPWLFRQNFPVHSFSSNWKQTPREQQTQSELLLYHIKKSQYLFYKHGVLHGINISVALAPSPDDIPLSCSWRIFWLALNTSYVMEFFLQTMVKRKVLSQSNMLWLQRLLMACASLSAAVAVMSAFRIPIFVASLVLNFVNRHYDVMNTMAIAVTAMNLLSFKVV